MKSGWKTTEFWITAFSGAAGILGTYGGLIPPPWGLILTTVVSAGYTISRGMVKTATTNGTPTQVPTVPAK